MTNKTEAVLLSLAAAVGLATIIIGIVAGIAYMVEHGMPLVILAGLAVITGLSWVACYKAVKRLATKD